MIWTHETPGTREDFQVFSPDGTNLAAVYWVESVDDVANKVTFTARNDVPALRSDGSDWSDDQERRGQRGDSDWKELASVSRTYKSLDVRPGHVPCPVCGARLAGRLECPTHGDQREAATMEFRVQKEARRQRVLDRIARRAARKLPVRLLYSGLPRSEASP